MFRKPLACALLLISAWPVFSNEARRVAWKVFDTPHFHIVFHEDVRPQAEMARDFLEQAYARIRADLGVRESGIAITFVLTGLPDESNGFSQSLGHRVVIYTRPGQVIGAGEIAWMKRVLAHELTHEITFLGLRKEFWGLYSELYKTSHLPDWFLEGLAQYEAESWDAKRNTFFAHVLYNSALEEYPALATYTKNDPLTGRLVYEQGHAFVRFLAHRQGPRFLSRLLHAITEYPLWTEIKFMLAPMTASYLPLESALLDLTGENVDALYAEFLAAMRAGLPANPRNPPVTLAEGVDGFAAVFEMKNLGRGDFLFTGQESWETDNVSLYRKDAAGVRKIGPDFLNPVFDLSPDGRRAAYVRSYSDPDGVPVEKLFVLDLATGAARFVSDGAAHPAFLGADTLAFSHYRHGRQALALCGLAGVPVCRDIPSDSLAGFYALSKSRRGLLCNATDTAGRTGIYEFSRDSGFVKLIGDSARAEYPVEAEDGSLRVVRDRGGLMQVDAWDRSSRAFTPVTSLPLGTLYLHRIDAHTMATLAQTGRPGEWSLRPTALPAVQPGTAGAPPAADSAATYQAPSFLVTSPPLFPPLAVSPGPAIESDYHSLLEIRPLVAYLVSYRDFPSTGIGPGILFQDPLQLHTVEASFNFMPNAKDPGYSVDYVNGQLPFPTHWSISNRGETVIGLDTVPGWDYIDLVNRRLSLTAGVNFPAPWDMPVANDLWLSVENSYSFHRIQLAADTLGKPAETLYENWVELKQEDAASAYLFYSYYPPYAYSAVHPLLLTQLSAGWTEMFPRASGRMSWFARQTLPIIDAFTYTLAYAGDWQTREPEFYQAVLPDGAPLRFYAGYRPGYTHAIYNSLDVPVAKNFTWEIPVLGLWNYFGVGAYEKAKWTVYPAVEKFGIARETRFSSVAGAKLVELFFPYRSIPLALSETCEFDLETTDQRFGIQIEMDGLTNAFSLRGAKHGPPDLGMDPEFANAYRH